MRNLSTIFILQKGATVRAEAHNETLPSLTIGEPYAFGSGVMGDRVTLVFSDTLAFPKLQRIADAINHILAEPVAAPLSVAAG